MKGGVEEILTKYAQQIIAPTTFQAIANGQAFKELNEAAHSLNELYLNKYLELPSMQDENRHSDMSVAVMAIYDGRNQLRQQLREEITKRLKEGQDE